MMPVTLKTTALYESASIKFLPIIDLNLSDETCIYSTLLFVIEEATKLNILSPRITFDQPLWQKSRSVIKEKNLQMVCRLDGFHILMSFLGSKANLMNDLCLEEVFEEVYSEDTFKYILSGHAIAGALRAHILVQSALVNNISKTLTDEGNLSESGLESLYSITMENGLSKEQIADVSNNDYFIKMVNAIPNYSKEKSKEPRTTKLWLLYIEQIYIVKEFPVAERACSWYLHLQALMNMINLFAACGHRNYAK